MKGHGGARPGAGRKRKEAQSDYIAQFNKARAEKETALARLRQAEADEKERALIRAEEVQNTVSRSFSVVAQSLLAIPDRLERVGMSGDQAEEVERIIHASMEGLADSLATLGTDPNPDNEAARQWLLDGLSR
ncbi:DUF1441 family protein [Ectothiorhodospira lacustris]|uniref:DUF1441 family protein n=1 Tax=Ectothiorhodospira lacustris TaxID=2899127 RepID=UPI001EE7A673|nr:DUF1441 family protein [Ectothiorhodospira lacustris]MCG5509630.1 DUF1441 family protein [Ectothiorhodospira lacustris]MCG5521575.1 DUF1441 family protein [Ectothiorhodospira lacustris]